MSTYLQRNNQPVESLLSLLDTAAKYNLVDLPTVRRLKLQFQNLPDNIFPLTMYGGKLPILAKASVHCKYIKLIKTLATLEPNITYHIQ